MDEFGKGILIGTIAGVLIVVSMLAFPCGDAEGLCRRARTFLCSGPR